MIIVAYFSLVRHETFFSRVMLAQAMFFSIVFLFALRLILQYLTILLWRKGIYYRNVFLFGNHDEFLEIAPFRFNSSLEDADELWCMSNADLHEAKRLAEKNHLIFRFIPSHLSYETSRMDLDIIHGLPILTPVSSTLYGLHRVLKRFFDIVFSLFFILISLIFLDITNLFNIQTSILF